VITGITLDVDSRGVRRRTGGRPSKGDRVFTAVRLPRPYRALLEEMADRDGIDVNDVVTRLVGEGLGQPLPDYCQPKVASEQEELPLNKAS